MFPRTGFSSTLAAKPGKSQNIALYKLLLDFM